MTDGTHETEPTQAVVNPVDAIVRCGNGSEFEFTIAKPQPHAGAICFHVGDYMSEPILTLDKKGMTYKGERVSDAGEAYYSFMEMMVSLNVGALKCR